MKNDEYIDELLEENDKERIRKALHYFMKHKDIVEEWLNGNFSNMPTPRRKYGWASVLVKELRKLDQYGPSMRSRYDRTIAPCG